MYSLNPHSGPVGHIWLHSSLLKAVGSDVFQNLEFLGVENGSQGKWHILHEIRSGVWESISEAGQLVFLQGNV